MHEATARLDLWEVPLDVPRELEPGLCGLLEPEERAHARRYAFDVHRRRFVARRAARRLVLGALLGMPPQDVRIRHDAHGKPRVDHARLSFSASHSGDWAVIGTLSGGSLGLDLEHVVAGHAGPGALSPFVAPAVLASLMALDDDERAVGFFRWWTRIEAAAKAAGTGITHLPAHRLSDQDDRDGVVDWPLPDGTAARWHLLTRVSGARIMTIATDRPDILRDPGAVARRARLRAGPDGQPVLEPFVPEGRTRRELPVACP